MSRAVRDWQPDLVPIVPFQMGNEKRLTALSGKMTGVMISLYRINYAGPSKNC